MKKALFIVGPTAVGKTALAVSLSKKFPSVLISADSIQVFRGADIISGKDHPKNVKIELIDIIDSIEDFSVSNFLQKIRPIIKNGQEENKIPIIVGGTGFYLDSLFGKIDSISIPPNAKLRSDLKKYSVQELQDELKKIDSNKLSKMNNSDINNPRRLIRAIEVASSKVGKTEPVFEEREILMIGLKTDSANLKKRIKKRVEQRIKLGAIDEAKKLFEKNKKLSPQIKSANGYKELFDYLLGKITLDQAIKEWEFADWHHAKHQMTWFNKKKNINWFDIQEKGFENQILKLINSAYSARLGTN